MCYHLMTCIFLYGVSFQQCLAAFSAWVPLGGPPKCNVEGDFMQKAFVLASASDQSALNVSSREIRGRKETLKICFRYYIFSCFDASHGP
jgi:hypothetical protein